MNEPSRPAPRRRSPTPLASRRSARSESHPAPARTLRTPPDPPPPRPPQPPPPPPPPPAATRRHPRRRRRAHHFVDHELEPARAALPRRADEHEHKRARVRSTLVHHAPVADRRVPGRGCGLAGDGARARDERAAVALPSRHAAAEHANAGAAPTTRAPRRSKRSSSGAACARSMRAIRACSPTRSRPGCTSCACSSCSRCRRTIAPR